MSYLEVVIFGSYIKQEDQQETNVIPLGSLFIPQRITVRTLLLETAITHKYRGNDT